jgi:hypothetical protein
LHTAEKQKESYERGSLNKDVGDQLKDWVPEPAQLQQQKAEHTRKEKSVLVMSLEQIWKCERTFQVRLEKVLCLYIPLIPERGSTPEVPDQPKLGAPYDEQAPNDREHSQEGDQW